MIELVTDPLGCVTLNWNFGHTFRSPCGYSSLLTSFITALKSAVIAPVTDFPRMSSSR